MFEKIGQLAEQTATRASRRQFLGRLGRGAMTLAAVVGGVLALPVITEGGHAVTACGPQSWLACVGKSEGDRCNVTYHVGICTGAPHCACRITRRRGDRR